MWSSGDRACIIPDDVIRGGCVWEPTAWVEVLKETVAWWEDIARKHGYCLGCGAPDGPEHHVYGERKCCPDCSHIGNR